MPQRCPYGCPYGSIWNCDCDRTEESYFYMCDHEDVFTEAAAACPECSKGIINPTIHLTMACDKCEFEEPITEIIKRPKYKRLAFLVTP